MKKYLLSAAILFSALFIFTACEKEKDNEKPVIELSGPEEGATLFIGHDVHFQVTLSDNEGLKSYKVNIHENMSNPHTHKSATRHAASDSVYFEKTWTEADFQKIAQTKGKTLEPIQGMKSKNIHHHLIEIPEIFNGKPVREGNYHFMIYCSDINGNESFESRNVVIRRPKDGEVHDHDHDHDHDHHH